MLNHATVFMQRALTVTSEEEEEEAAAGRSGVLQQQHPEQQQLQLQPLHQLQDQHLQQQDPQVWKQEDYVTVHENLLDKPSQEPGVCLFGSKIYLMGGYLTMRHEHLDNPGDTGLGTDRFTIYDMANSSVVEGPPLPVRANHLGCAVSPTGTLHMTGGFCQNCNMTAGQTMSHTRHWVFDTHQLEKEPTTNTTTNANHQAAQWEFRAPLPVGVGAHGCQFLRDGKMYCAGGGLSQWGPFSDQLVIYDPTTDSWTRGGHATHTLEEFDPMTGLYYCHRPLPYPVSATAAGTYEGKLHIVGGREP
jgi:hypothetical protein